MLVCRGAFHKVYIGRVAGFAHIRYYKKIAFFSSPYIYSVSRRQSCLGKTHNKLWDGFKKAPFYMLMHSNLENPCQKYCQVYGMWRKTKGEPPQNQFSKNCGYKKFLKANTFIIENRAEQFSVLCEFKKEGLFCISSSCQYWHGAFSHIHNKYLAKCLRHTIDGEIFLHFWKKIIIWQNWSISCRRFYITALNVHFPLCERDMVGLTPLGNWQP